MQEQFVAIEGKFQQVVGGDSQDYWVDDEVSSGLILCDRLLHG